MVAFAKTTLATFASSLTFALESFSRRRLHRWYLLLLPQLLLLLQPLLMEVDPSGILKL